MNNSIIKNMKPLIIALLFIQLGCECKNEKCGVITEVIKTGKSGEVMVLYPDGKKEIVKKRRPIQSMIGDKHCYCISTPNKTGTKKL